MKRIGIINASPPSSRPRRPNDGYGGLFPEDGEMKPRMNLINAEYVALPRTIGIIWHSHNVPAGCYAALRLCFWWWHIIIILDRAK
jgi:hypothetical protein